LPLRSLHIYLVHRNVKEDLKSIHSFKEEMVIVRIVYCAD